jgi:MarR family transcriptional regulator, organic hydroperoxide resistance regulator
MNMSSIWLPCTVQNVISTETSTETEVRGNVGFLIWRLSMRWRAAMDRVLAPLGLTHAQYAVLAPLWGMSRGGARPSQRELADLTGLDPVYVSKLVRALERDGFVARSVKAADPRAVELALTAQGEATVQQGIEAVYAMRDRLTRPLGGNDGARTAELAKMICQLLDAPEDAPPGDAPGEG